MGPISLRSSGWYQRQFCCFDVAIASRCCTIGVYLWRFKCGCHYHQNGELFGAQHSDNRDKPALLRGFFFLGTKHSSMVCIQPLGAVRRGCVFQVFRLNPGMHWVLKVDQTLICSFACKAAIVDRMGNIECAQNVGTPQPLWGWQLLELKAGLLVWPLDHHVFFPHASFIEDARCWWGEDMLLIFVRFLSACFCFVWSSPFVLFPLP